MYHVRRITEFRIIVKWLVRILALFYVVYISTFALNVFDKEPLLWKTIFEFIIRLIPSLILIIIIILAWKRELIGAVGFILISLRLTLHFNTLQNLNRFLVISAPLLFIGFLFLLSKFLKNYKS